MKIKTHYKKYAKKHRVSKKWFDIFTTGHFIKGFISFLLAFIVFNQLGVSMGDKYWGSLVVVFFCATVFEILENTVWKIIKPDGRDSLRNSLADIMFDFLGGVTAWILVFMIELAI